MKKEVLKCVAILVIQFVTHQLFAQGEFGGHIKGQNWQILSSPAIRVIYPQGMDSQAVRIANLINHIDQNNRRSVGDKKRRFDMVLQNQTTIPNGYVGLAPFRSEFFSTPPQNNLLIGSSDWLDELAIHEYRHALQFMNTRRGLTKFGSIVMGEQAWSILGSISIPNWYFEGDAVVSETALSNNGRGRAPFFSMEQRALALAGKDYGYLKNRNGSLKSLIPDHYRLGYMMMTKAREVKGNDVTAKVLHEAAAYRGVFSPFSKALKRNVGYNSKELFDLAWKDGKAKWAEQLKNTPLITTTPVTEKAKRTVTNYRFPRFLSNGSLVVNKSSYKKTDAIYLLKNGTEKELTTIGIGVDDNITVGKGIIAWTELSVNPRWGYQDFSKIMMYNTETGERKELTSKSRYFSPVVSPTGEALAAIHISPTQQNQIHILNPQTGAEIKVIENPKNYFLSRLAWSADGKNLVSIAKYNNKLALVKFDLSENTITELTTWTHHTMEAPTISGNQVYFNAGFSGIDNIFRTDLTGSKAVYPITSVPIGAFEPDVSPDGKTLVFTEFTEMGYVVSKQALNSENGQAFTIVEPAEMPQFQTVANNTEGGNILDKPMNQSYEARPYKGLFTGLKLHSWAVSPSLSIPFVNVSTINMLNDVLINVGGGINRNEKNGGFYNAAIAIGRFYPIIVLKGAQAQRVTDFYSTADTMATKTFNERDLGASVIIPWKWIQGNIVTALTPSLNLNYRSLSKISAENNPIANSSFGAYDAGVSFFSLRRTATQNVGLRRGIMLDAHYYQSLAAVKNEKINASGKVFLPGLGANHNLVLKGAFQRELLKNSYQFADEFEYPRGFTTPINDEFTNISFEYGMPLFYPDCGIKGLTYFKRIRANLFFDKGVGKRLDKRADYNSAGVELFFDNTYLNFIPISVGLRLHTLLTEDPLNKGGRKTGLNFFVGGTF